VQSAPTLVALAFELLLLVTRFQSRVARLAENLVLLVVTIEARRERDFDCQAVLPDSFADKGLEVGVEMAFVRIVQLFG
jgi:hypothetical protein